MGLRYSRLVQTVDSHTEGNPTRVVVGGLRTPPGASLGEQVAWLKRHDDALRRLLVLEPRGGALMCAVYLLPAHAPGADLAVVIVEPDEYVPMSGHCIIGAATTVVATGMVPLGRPRSTVTFETLAGLVRCDVAIEGDRVGPVTFENVGSFLLKADLPLDLGLGQPACVDVAYGGCFYAIAEADALGLDIAATNEAAIIATARRLIVALNRQHSIVHPDDPTIRRCYQTLFWSRRASAGAVRQVIVAPPGAVDRSPCGTGASAHLAAMVARGTARTGERVRFEGPLGTVFTAEAAAIERRGDLTMIRPRITGRAWITGFHQFVLDPEDPFPEGLRLGDPARDQAAESVWGAPAEPA